MASTLSLLGQHRDFGSAATVWEAAAGPFADLLALEQSLAEQAHALAEVADEAAMSRYGRDLERFEREGRKSRHGSMLYFRASGSTRQRRAPRVWNS